MKKISKKFLSLSSRMSSTPEEVLKFWFEELTPRQHFMKDSIVDETIRTRFGATLEAAAQCELYSWRATTLGRVAEVIVLDQFSRNAFRDTPRSFAQDPLALALSQELVASGLLSTVDQKFQKFAVMPFMHSESKVVHREAVGIFTSLGEDILKFELKHKEIIDRFGRYPHRNRILGRASTQEEEEFLSQPGSSF